MRNTRQRAAVLAALHQIDEHPTADQIFREVRKTLPHISLGTVYRTLDLLEQEGMIRVLDFGPRRRRYDIATDHHAHVVCLACGRIVDVPASTPAVPVQSISAVTGFRITGHRTEWYGYCPDCIRSAVSSGS
ncbi:MAG: transcriptional repressor [Chloroherpetonaceae bacterium]|nr:transcriptional repressor [Chthonomonadaceae bacterium]MDW8209131.1 transcriptional repressor [Chloroherpetonaceae bacterium]